jgi:hypothetical protein
MDINISKSTKADIEGMVELSYKKRRFYEKAEPQFWKWAGEEGEKTQAEWFEQLLYKEDYIILIAKSNNIIQGFIIGRLVLAPEVYNPGGLTLMIDDFCVRDESDWKTVGGALIKEIKLLAKTKNVAQILVVSGDHDGSKCQFLEKLGLTVASRWYVGNM